MKHSVEFYVSMKFKIRLVTVFTLLITAALAQTPAQRMLVVISLDGFPAFALDDPKLPIPALRKLIQNGVSARMTTVNPTVTWPNHTAMLTGVSSDQHGLLANGTILRTGGWPPVKIEPMLDKEKMVHVPTVYDAAYKAGLTTAQVDWVAINRAPGITWAFSEWASADGLVQREMIRQTDITAADLDNFTKSNILFRDQIWTTAAVHLIREHQPNLLLVHLLSLDSVHHQYGPNTLAAKAAIAFLDSCVARLVEAVRAAGMGERSTFFVVSDHGFKSYTKQIRPPWPSTPARFADKVYTLPEGGTAYVYFDPADANWPQGNPRSSRSRRHRQDHRPGWFSSAWLAATRPGAANVPAASNGQGRILLLGSHGRSSYSRSLAARGQSRILGQRPRHGRDFHRQRLRRPRGHQLQKIANIDVAPTIAKLPAPRKLLTPGVSSRSIEFVLPT